MDRELHRNLEKRRPTFRQKEGVDRGAPKSDSKPHRIAAETRARKLKGQQATPPLCNTGAYLDTDVNKEPCRNRLQWQSAPNISTLSRTGGVDTCVPEPNQGPHQRTTKARVRNPKRPRPTQYQLTESWIGREDNVKKTKPRTELTTNMALPKATQRSGNTVGGGLIPTALSKVFGADDDDMDTESPSQSLRSLLAEKASRLAKGGSNSKRARDPTVTPSHSKSPPARTQVPKPNPEQQLRLWLGFDTMEKLAIDQGIEELFTDETIADRVTRGIPLKEAEELESVSISFPRVPQTLYPSKRRDGLPGQHLNLTQLPNEIEIDPISCMSLDFQIAIHFQLPNNPLFHNHVKELVKERLKEMNIPLGTNLIEPISVLCMSIKRGGIKGVWAGIVKLHLLHPQTDGEALLTGLRPFILQLEPHSHVGNLGKVCKSYHSIARSNNLSIKISNETLIGISSHALFLDVLENSFRRGHDFEIVEVQKSLPNNHAYIVAPTPLQAKKIQTLQVSTLHQILEGQVTKGPSLTSEQKARKDALTLTLYNLPILMNIEDTSLEICKVLGTKNVVSIWFQTRWLEA